MISVNNQSNFYNFTIFVYSSYGIAAIAPFSHRLAFDNMPEDIQRLRCKVNFQALTFVPHIISLGDALVSRLRYSPSASEMDSTNYLRQVGGSNDKQGTGKFVVLHLRFDKVCSLVQVLCTFLHASRYFETMDQL